MGDAELKTRRDNTRQDFIYTLAVTQQHRRNIYINILLYTRDKMVDSKYMNYNTNTYTKHIHINILCNNRDTRVYLIDVISSC